MNEQQKIGALEAMLFAHADPVEAARLADALRVEPEEAVRLLKKLQRKLDEEESGMAILYFDPDRWQMATRPYYGEMVKRILDTRRNAPLSPAALEVLSVIAYNQPVSRSFIEQVRGVDSSSIVAKLLEKGLIEEARQAHRVPGHRQFPACVRPGLAGRPAATAWRSRGQRTLGS